MNSSVDYTKLKEELSFWQQHQFQIFVKKQIPNITPSNNTISRVLSAFQNDYNYYVIGRRISKLLKIKKAFDQKNTH